MRGRFGNINPTKSMAAPTIEYDAELQSLLSQADRKLGRLDGITQFLPNAEVLAAMYVKKEAVLSSQLDGSQASLDDVLSAEYEQGQEQEENVGWVMRYEKAVSWGLAQLEKVPLSGRLVRSIQSRIFPGNRELPKKPGKIRRRLKRPDPEDSTPVQFAADMEAALEVMDGYFVQDDTMPALIKIGLLHAELETRRRGSGRIGRMMISLWLRQKQVLTKPLLYLSYYFKKNRAEYYARLAAVRKQEDWTGWLKFFLKGVAEVADEAANSAAAILQLREDLTRKLREKDNGNANYQKLLSYLFEQPFIKRQYVAQLLDVSNPTAGGIIDTFCQLGILEDRSPGRSRNKTYAFAEYLAILEKGTEPD